ncbi:MAG: rubredoxin [Leptospirales bacterium]|nr:rubredoxin [Leptospirales bacterium]
MLKFKCSICGYVYDESVGIPEKNIPTGTKWEYLPNDFACPLCTAPKALFKPIEEPTMPMHTSNAEAESHEFEKLRELSAGEISAICYSLAKGCEKQRLNAEMEAFNKIADYFKSKAIVETGKNLQDIEKMLDVDMTTKYSAANNAANANADRGALRSLVWSEKVSTMMKSLLNRFEKEGDAMLANTKVFVCDICGFIYLGNTPPEICPVCKVPNYKIIQVERR